MHLTALLLRGKGKGGEERGGKMLRTLYRKFLATPLAILRYVAALPCEIALKLK